jgi:oligopeptide/dipeptide ABC transporter ATP-binding protein
MSSADRRPKEHGHSSAAGSPAAGGRAAGGVPSSSKAPAAAPSSSNGQPLMEASHLKLYFPVKQGVLIDRTIAEVHAVDDVSVGLQEGETLGVVGESGCGKSTLARCMVRLLEPTEGVLRFRGLDITHLGRRQLKPFRREAQLVFQDPVSSLNPRKRVGQIVGTPLHVAGMDRNKIGPRVAELLDRVGLNPEHVNRFPHEFSGGQRQRIGVARALAVDPRLIVLDEPVSALDVSIQAQVINLLDDLQDDFGLSYVFIAHDLSVVRHVSDRIGVMYLGKIVELSPAQELYVKPIHPYTEALLAAIPIPDPKENRARHRRVVSGEPPNPINPPSGCRFHTRCSRATDVCKRIEPPLVEYPGGHLAACHHPLSVSESDIAAAKCSDLSPLSAGQLLPDRSEAARGDEPVSTEAQAAPAQPRE